MQPVTLLKNGARQSEVFTKKETRGKSEFNQGGPEPLKHLELSVVEPSSRSKVVARTQHFVMADKIGLPGSNKSMEQPKTVIKVRSDLYEQSNQTTAESTKNNHHDSNSVFKLGDEIDIIYESEKTKNKFKVKSKPNVVTKPLNTIDLNKINKGFLNENGILVPQTKIKHVNVSSIPLETSNVIKPTIVTPSGNKNKGNKIIIQKKIGSKEVTSCINQVLNFQEKKVVFDTKPNKLNGRSNIIIVQKRSDKSFPVSAVCKNTLVKQIRESDTSAANLVNVQCVRMDQNAPVCNRNEGNSIFLKEDDSQKGLGKQQNTLRLPETVKDIKEVHHTGNSQNDVILPSTKGSPKAENTCKTSHLTLPRAKPLVYHARRRNIVNKYLSPADKASGLVSSKIGKWVATKERQIQTKQGEVHLSSDKRFVLKNTTPPGIYDCTSSFEAPTSSINIDIDNDNSKPWCEKCRQSFPTEKEWTDHLSICHSMENLFF